MLQSDSIAELSERFTQERNGDTCLVPLVNNSARVPTAPQTSGATANADAVLVEDGVGDAQRFVDCAADTEALASGALDTQSLSSSTGSAEDSPFITVRHTSILDMRRGRQHLPAVPDMSENAANLGVPIYVAASPGQQHPVLQERRGSPSGAVPQPPVEERGKYTRRVYSREVGDG